MNSYFYSAGLKPAAADARKRIGAAIHRVPGFSLIEILVVVALLSLIIIGLVAMFAQTQRAFRTGTTQVDVLEAGRATSDLLQRDLASITPAYQGTNNYNVKNFYMFLRNYEPLIQPLPGATGSPGRTNLLEEIFFLTRENQTWTGIGYFVRTNDPVSNQLGFPEGGAGGLYRFTTNYPDAVFKQNPGIFIRDFSEALFRERRNGTNLVSKIMDGVVHFKVTAYDTNGVRIVQDWHPGRVNSDIRLSTTVAPGEVGLYNFYSNAVPASVEVELGILEQRTAERVKSIPNSPARRTYLEDQAGKVHLFRLRVPVRNVDPVAYQ